MIGRMAAAFFCFSGRFIVAFVVVSYLRVVIAVIFSPCCDMLPLLVLFFVFFPIGLLTGPIAHDDLEEESTPYPEVLAIAMAVTIVWTIIDLRRRRKAT